MPPPRGYFPQPMTTVGPEGPAGANGQGVPAGGAINHVLAKLSAADYNTGWVPAGTPAAHATSHQSGGGDVLTLAQSQVTGLVAALAATQPLDADLTALAANATTGFLSRTGAGTAAARTITGTTGRLTVTNGDGVSGNPTLDVGADVYRAGGTDVAIADGGTGASTAVAARSALGLGILATLATVGAAEISDDAVTNDKLTNMATATFKGRTTAGTGNPEDLTVTQATALIETFTSALKGLAPASGGGTVNFLRADGTWVAPPGGGGSALTVKENDVAVDTTVAVIDFGNGFDVAETPEDEVQITLDLAEYTGTDLPVASGGTGASDAATARTNLGLSIDSQVQAFDADLSTIAGLTATTDNVLQSVGSAWASRTPAQLKATLALVKGDVGLGNVDNTSNVTERAAAATLTNKTVALGSNTVSGTTAQFNTANTDGDFYTTGGTDVALADGGTGVSLTDPGADRLWFWDDSVGAIGWLTLGTNLSITGTTIDAAGGGGGVSDGDKGDITVSAAGTVWTVDPDAITYAKLQDVSATDRLLGRSTAGAGDVEEIVCTPFARSLLNDTAAVNARTTLDVNDIWNSWWKASSFTPTMFDFYEDTDNGADLIRLRAPSAVAATVEVELPGVAGTIALVANTQAADPFLQDIADLTDPAADRILFWDDSAGELVWLTPGTNLSITGTTIDATGGGGGLANIVEDTTPQLGGNLDLNTFTVGAATAADLTKLNALTASAAELNFVDGVTSAIQGQIDGKQASDADLTTIAGLAATTDNVIQSVASAWASRTPAQLKTTLALVKGDVGLGNVDNTSNVTERAAAATLTNKTVDLTSNTLVGSVAEFNTALESADFYTSGGTDVAIADGGTGASTANAGFNALSPMTTDGDLIIRAAGVGARLPVGSNGQALKIVSGAPAWASGASQADGGLYNFSTASQGAGFATDTYLTGSAIALPATLKAGSIYKCRFRASKTAAGTATPIINVRVGAAGTTSDTSRGTLTFSVGTAAIDEAEFELWVVFRTIGAGTSAVVQSVCAIRHTLDVTGFIATGSETETATSGGFASTAGHFIGVSVNGGTSAAWTVQQVAAELVNLAWDFDSKVDEQAGFMENLTHLEYDVNVVAATGATETLDVSLFNVHDCTMDQACTFTFGNPAPSGEASAFILILRGAFTPTLPASVDWGDASAPTYTTPSMYGFTTVDGGTTWLGTQVGKAFG